MGEETNFKVTDRRLFNPDGSQRDVPADEKPEPAMVETPSAPVAEPPVPETASSARSSADDRAEASEEFDGSDDHDPASFVNFIMSIASNAASSLGMMEHPVTHQHEVDLELARHWIDVLGMLQHKTRGNLALQERQMMEGLLSDLRLQYVSLSGKTAPQARQSYSGSDIIGGKS